MEKMHTLYRIFNTQTGQTRYIGQTANASKRWYEHRRQAATDHPKQLIHKELKEVGTVNFDFEVIATAQGQENTDAIEEILIRQYNTLSPMGCNIRDGRNNNPPIQTKPNSGSFKTGEHRSPSTEIKQGQRLSPHTEFKPGQVPPNKGVKGTTNFGQTWKIVNGRREYTKKAA